MFGMHEAHRSARTDAGFSLVEMLIAAVILPFVLSAAYLVFITLSGNYSSISAQSEATSEAQRAMDVLVREVRQAQEATTGCGAIDVAEPDRCSFFVDLDHTGVPSRITYYVQGTDLFRVVGKATIPVSPYIFVDGTAERVVNLTTSTGVVFTYYDESAPGTPVTGTPNPPTIVAVGVHLTASRPAQTGMVSVDFSTRVKIRALFDSLS